MQAPVFEHTHFSINAYPQHTVITFNRDYSWLYPLFKDYITNISIHLGDQELPLIPKCFEHERTIELEKHTNIAHSFLLGFFLSKTLLKDTDSWSQFCKFYEQNEGIAYNDIFTMPHKAWNDLKVIDLYAFCSLNHCHMMVPLELLSKLQYSAPLNPFEPAVVPRVLSVTPVQQPSSGQPVLSFFRKPTAKPDPMEAPCLKVIGEALKIGMNYVAYMEKEKKDPNNQGTLRAIAVNRILASESVSLGCKMTVLWALLNKKTDGLFQNFSKGTEFVKRLRENSIIAGLNHSNEIQQQAEKYCQSRAQNYPGMTALTIQEKILEKLKLGPKALGPDNEVAKDVNIMPPAIAFAKPAVACAMTETGETKSPILKFLLATNGYLQHAANDFFEHRGLNRAHALKYILMLDEKYMSVACKMMIIHGVITLESGALCNNLRAYVTPQLENTATEYAQQQGLDVDGLKALQQFILNKMLNTKIGDYATWTEASLTAGFVINKNITHKEEHIEEDDWQVMSIKIDSN